MARNQLDSFLEAAKCLKIKGILYLFFKLIYKKIKYLSLFNNFSGLAQRENSSNWAQEPIVAEESADDDDPADHQMILEAEENLDHHQEVPT